MRGEIVEWEPPEPREQLTDAMDVDYAHIPVLTPVACKVCGSKCWERRFDVTRCHGCKAAVWHQDYTRIEMDDGEALH